MKGEHQSRGCNGPCPVNEESRAKRVVTLLLNMDLMTDLILLFIIFLNSLIAFKRCKQNNKTLLKITKPLTL